jgi:DNA-binding NtrC family response regulator
VLVVDDEDGPREALGMVLERSFRVLTADGGASALRTLADTQVDVVMLDLRMPEMDGIETLRRIRDLDPDVEVVIVTAVPPYDVAWECMRLRAFDVLRKPFSAAEIMATAQRAAASRSVRHDDKTSTAVIAPLVDELVKQLEGMSTGVIEREVMSYARLLARWLQSLVQKPSGLRLRDALSSLPQDEKIDEDKADLDAAS